MRLFYCGMMAGAKYRSRLQFTYGITISLFFVSALVGAYMILPLAYAQQQIIIGKDNPAINPIKHIVVIMQENRSFDNYFGTWRKCNT
jgi:phospholipase C